MNRPQRKLILISFLALLMAMGLALLLAGCGDEQKANQPATPTVPPGATEAAGTPGPTRPAWKDYPVDIPTLAPSLTLPEKRPCPDKWQRISNDVLNYSICVPPDWGILNERTGERLTWLTVHAESLRILSPEGFPYPLSVPPYESLQDPDMNLIYVALSPVPPGSGIACDAKPRASLGSLPAVGCQFRFNYTDLGDADYRADGTMVEIDTVVPLPNPQAGLAGPRTGYGLFIGIVGDDKAMGIYHDTISQILDTVEGQP